MLSNIDRARSIVERFAGARVMVVGDLVIDEHRMGTVARLSREAPLPVIEQREQSYLAGGAANLAMNLRSVGVAVSVLGAIGDDPLGQRLAELIGSSGAEVTHLLKVPGSKTPSKLRIWASGDRQASHQQVARIDADVDMMLSADVNRELADRLRRAVGGCDAVIFSDYEGGVVAPQILAAARSAANESGTLLVADSHGGFERFTGYDAITPNQPEAESFLGERFADVEAVLRRGGAMLERIACREVLMTLGADGMALFQAGQRPLHIAPHPISSVTDTTGAGDTAAAVFVAGRIAGASAAEAATLANCAAAVIVGQVGVATVTGPQIIDGLFGRA